MHQVDVFYLCQQSDACIILVTLASCIYIAHKECWQSLLLILIPNIKKALSDQAVLDISSEHCIVTCTYNWLQIRAESEPGTRSARYFSVASVYDINTTCGQGYKITLLCNSNLFSNNHTFLTNVQNFE